MSLDTVHKLHVFQYFFVDLIMTRTIRQSCHLSDSVSNFFILSYFLLLLLAVVLF